MIDIKGNFRKYIFKSEQGYGDFLKLKRAVMVKEKMKLLPLLVTLPI